MTNPINDRYSKMAKEQLEKIIQQPGLPKSEQEKAVDALRKIMRDELLETTESNNQIEQKVLEPSVDFKHTITKQQQSQSTSLPNTTITNKPSLPVSSPVLPLTTKRVTTDSPTNQGCRQTLLRTFATIFWWSGFIGTGLALLAGEPGFAIGIFFSV